MGGIGARGLNGCMGRGCNGSNGCRGGSCACAAVHARARNEASTSSGSCSRMLLLLLLVLAGYLHGWRVEGWGCKITDAMASAAQRVHSSASKIIGILEGCI